MAERSGRVGVIGNNKPLRKVFGSPWVRAVRPVDGRAQEMLDSNISARCAVRSQGVPPGVSTTQFSREINVGGGGDPMILALFAGIF